MNKENVGLYDQSFEHDNCGIGAVVNIKGLKTYKTVDDALKIVEQLEHRAGKDAAGETSAIDTFITNNCKAIISFSSFDRAAQIEQCEAAGVYYAVATGTLTDEEYETYKGYEHYVGAIGPSLEVEYQTGYDMANFDLYLDNFDKEIGIDKIGCIHINDSKNPINSHKDRHENIGFGTIGFDNLIKIIYNKRLENIPKILETPYIDDEEISKKRVFAPYKFEIKMIKDKTFNNNLLNDIKEYYKK